MRRCIDVISENTETKDGRPIRFRYLEDFEGDENRGWTVDRVEAVIDQREAGHLTIEYIPKERLKSHYRDIFDWQEKINGGGAIPWQAQGLHYTEMSDEQLKRMIELVSWTQFSKDVKATGSRPELLQWIERIKARMEEEHGSQFARFKHFHVDHPMVGYIEVQLPFRRQGVGRALYIAGAQWMARKGLHLYASRLQSAEAKSAWDRLTADGMTARDKRGLFLNL